MKRMILAVIVATGLWSGWWAWVAWQTQSSTTAWFDARRAQGWEASYADLALRGFPNRVDRTFTDLTLADPQARVVWTAPFFQLFQLTYKTGHVIAIWPNDQELTIGGTRWQITGEGLRGSFVTEGGALARSNLEARVLNLNADDGRALALAHPRVAFLQQDGDPLLYRLAVTADAVAGPDGGRVAGALPETASALQADVTVRFDRPWTQSEAPVTRPQPRQIDLRLAEYRYGDLRLKLTGALEIDDSGQPQGRLTVRAENWRGLLRAAVEAGQMPQSLADTLAQGLALIAGLGGNPDSIDVPLNFERGQTRLGPIPLGPAPVIRLP